MFDLLKNAYFIFFIRNEDKAVENLQTYQILDSKTFWPSTSNQRFLRKSITKNMEQLTSNSPIHFFPHNF